MQNQQKQSSKRPYTGVDKLILAAMMEDRAAAAVQASSYLPTGRGIGYFGHTRDTYAQIPHPSNKSERELYQLLERANLLIYFGTFLNFGGDDVQQLSDADEEEFLEIMSLVGMTQKPLHVRRLQKALIEWRDMKESECFAQRSQLNSSNLGVGNSHNVINSMLSDSYTFATTSSPTKSFGNQTTGETSQSQQQFPSEVIVGAPKRLRLMDHLHRSSDKPDDVCQLRFSSPKSDKSADEEEDKLIEVMESSHSDVEPYNHNDTTASIGSSTNKIIPTTTANTTGAATCSSSSNQTELVHSKFGRYRASLVRNHHLEKEGNSPG